IVVEIRDAATGQPLAASAHGAVQDHEYVDSLVPAGFRDTSYVSMFSRQAAYERPGTYSVRVQLAGYRNFDTTGIRVLKAPCHVKTVHLDARLSPTG
ncbi:MAG: hypothetical protein ACYC7F_13585, partial [Gemmatimonadaceae bacterium]